MEFSPVSPNPIENFEIIQFKKFSKKNFATISFGNVNYAKFSKHKSEGFGDY